MECNNVSNNSNLFCSGEYMSYFKTYEFECKCGCGLNNISPFLVTKLDRARGFAKTKFIINSGCRCNSHNKKIKGSRTSSHLQGLAVDIKCNNGLNRINIIKGLILAGFKRIGVANTFIHVDIDESKPDSNWLY